MKRKKFIAVLAALMSACCFAAVFSACSDETEPESEKQELFLISTSEGVEVSEREIASEYGAEITLYHPYADFSAADVESITLEQAFSGLTVTSVETQEDYTILSVTIQGVLTEKQQTGIVNVDASATGLNYALWGELYIKNEEFSVRGNVDEGATEHYVIISGETISANTEATAADFTFSGAFSEMEYVSASFVDGAVTMTFRGEVESEEGNAGIITLSSKASGYYLGCEVAVEVVRPRVNVYDPIIGFGEAQVIYLQAENFAFAEELDADDFSFDFGSQDNDLEILLRSAISVISVENVYGILAVTIDIDESIFDMELNSYHNAFSLVIGENATSLTRDITATLIFDTVFCHYDVDEIFAVDYTTMTFTFYVEGGAFNTELKITDVICDRENALITVSVSNNVLTVVITVNTDEDNRIVNFTIENAIYDDVYGNEFDLEITHVYGEMAMG